MKSSENNERRYENIDQVEDLTQFLDEDFDTDDVDLFEFTTEEDSPLTVLKSIVLSLEWEITDEILQDLDNEVYNLQEDEAFQADKVSQVYLQGLGKIGQYLQSEGAYSHPNAVKLLLKFFYDFEKILSSETITGPEITALLKADVRKFKILQYQIAKKHGLEAPVSSDDAKIIGLLHTDSEVLRGIRATILELDWEVTDEGLDRLGEHLDEIRAKYPGDQHINILLHGLYALKAYIYDEKGQAHPEAYSLLHSFSDGIGQFIENTDIGDDERMQILVGQVNALNNLKSLIAGIEPQVEEAQTVKQEGAASAVRTEVEPASDLSEVAVEEIDEELDLFADESFDEDIELEPALSSDSAEGSEIEEEETPDELEEKLEFFFGGDNATPPPSDETSEIGKIDEEIPLFEEELQDENIEPEPSPPDVTPEEPELELDLESGDFEASAPLFEEENENNEEFSLFSNQEEEEGIEFSLEDEAQAPAIPAEDTEDFFEEDIEPALSGNSSEGSEIELDEPSEDLQDKLEYFFGDDEGQEPTPEAHPTFTPEPEPEPATELTFEEDFEPALTGGDNAEQSEIVEEETPPELAEKLDYFFGSDDDVTPFSGETPPQEDKIEPSIEDEPEEEEYEEIVPALSGSPEESGFELEEDSGEIPDTLDEKLDSLFGASTEEEPIAEISEDIADETEGEPEVEDEPEITPALDLETEESEIIAESPTEDLEEKLSYFFGDSEDTATDQLTEEPEIFEPALSDSIDTFTEQTQVTTDAESTQSVAEMQENFKKLEDILRQEISTLKEEIESLKIKIKA